MLELYLFPYRADPNWPSPEAEPALFLDLDGTLLEIAATPDEVVVPPRLIEFSHHLLAVARKNSPASGEGP